PKIYDGLVSYDFDFNPKPQLATSWEISSDGLTYTFHLRQGVKWHDGKPFTSADVAFSLTEIWKPLTSRGKVLYADLEGVDTPDDHTVIFRFSKPVPPLIVSLASFFTHARIMPKHIY